MGEHPMTMVQQAIEVSAPLHTVYEQLATFENYPRFMQGVEEVTRVGHDHTHWIIDVDGLRREFDATITERSVDERVAWVSTDEPWLAETLTLRPIGAARTQIVAQLEADVTRLLPSDRHGSATLNRRLKSDLHTFKSLCESGKLGTPSGRTANKQVSGRSSTFLGSGAQPDRSSPVPPHTGRHAAAPDAGWGDGVGAGTAPMGGQALPVRNSLGDETINEEERGSGN